MIESIARVTLAEYGEDFRADGALGRFQRAIERSARISTPAHYVGACRRVACRFGRTLPTDGRLVAVGYRHETPSAWIRDERLDAFLRYWDRAVLRPDVVGSEYNPIPERVYAAWRSGVPARWVRLGVWQSDRLSISRRERARLERAARAAGRTSCPRQPGRGWPSVTVGALSQLGRLSPELQRALLTVSGAYEGERWQRPLLGCSGLRWDLVAPIASAMAADSTGRVRAAWATGARQRALAHAAGALPEVGSHVCHGTSCGRCEEAVAAWLAPGYAGLPLPLAVRMCRGESPVQLSGGALSRRESHQWLHTAPTLEPIEWLQRGLADVPPLRDHAVVRWLLDIQRRGSWAQLTRERTVYGPAGEERVFRYLDKIDEIDAGDLGRGAATRVEDAFRSAAERYGTDAMDRWSSDHRVLAPASGWPLYPRAMRELRTRAALVAEGRTLDHCVGGYGDAVERRQVVILSLSVGPHRSTAELAWPSGRLIQHRGPSNTQPAPVLERLMARFIARMGRQR